jgi:hypothetical protein
MHRLWVLIHGLAVARILGRTAVLDRMHLDPYHNRTRDEQPRPCAFSPKLFFDWALLNQAVETKAANEFEDFQKHLKASNEDRVTSIDLSREYQATFLTAGQVYRPDDFYGSGRYPETAIKNCKDMFHHIDFSGDIKMRAREIILLLGDFDAIHVRRGDNIKREPYRGYVDVDVIRLTDFPQIIERLKHWIEPGRKLFIATDERDLTFFDGLRDVYDVYVKEDFAPVLADHALPEGARYNMDYLMCIESEVLTHARRFVGLYHTALCDLVDWRRSEVSGIDRGIYNLTPDRYLANVKQIESRGRWYPCLLYENLKERIVVTDEAMV